MRNTLPLGTTVKCYDVAEALAGQYGTFKVTIPNGPTFVVTCKPNSSISNWEGGDYHNPQIFLITKIAEPVNTEGTPTLLTQTA